MKLIIPSVIFSILFAVASKLNAATESSVLGQFGNAIGSLVLYYSIFERVNETCGVELTTGKEEIDTLLRDKVGVSLRQVEEVLGAASRVSTELHVNKVVSGVENYIGCDKEELNAVQRHFMLTVFQPHFEQIRQIEDTERIRSFIRRSLE